MLKTLMAGLPALRKTSRKETPEIKIDISRVIKAPAAQQTAPMAGPEQVAEETTDASTESLANLAEEAVDSLSSQFENWMRGDLDQLVGDWQAAQKPAATAEHYRAVFTAAHNIKGAANSYGYPAIARLCGSLSRLLADTRPGENSALINLHVEACRAAFNSIGQGSDGQSIADAVCEALEARVAMKVSSD